MPAIKSAKNAKPVFIQSNHYQRKCPKNMTMMRLRDAVNDGLTIAPRMVLCGANFNYWWTHGVFWRRSYRRR